VLSACGDKFVANTGSASVGGSPSAGSGDAPAEVEAGIGGSAGHDDGADAGDVGSEPGGGGSGGGSAGARARGGAGGQLGIAGGGSGGVSGGSGGVSGGGGSLIEPTLPSGLLLWLRADRGIQQKDGHVQVWLDQSDNHANATATGLARPTYLADGFNGRPTLDFDGQEQFLKFAEGFGDFSKGLAGFIVAKPTTTACESMLEFSNGSEIDDIALGMYEDKWAYEVAASVLHVGTINHDAFSIYAANHRPAGASELRINGGVLDTLEMPLPVLPESGVRSNNFVGHTLYGSDCQYFTGQISEIIVYSRALTNPELSVIEKYLDAHWGVTDQDTPTPTPSL